MASHESWKLLSINVPNVPQLLVKSHFDHTGYRIHLTDLSRIWEESLNKVECVRRASDSSSSIDPSQDEEQFQILLDKIQSALNHANGTSLHLKTNGEDEQILSIQLIATLPKPLPPLKWTINLRLLEPSQIRTQLVSPLLNQANRLQHQVEQLVSELQDKDRVITKICDRLETSGNDLTTVFPGVSNIKTSRKKGQREQLAKHVKGLADFEENTWRKQSSRQLGDQTLSSEELASVLDDVPGAGNHSAAAEPEWWKLLDHEAVLQSPSELNTAPKASNGAVGDEPESIQDNEFQTQDTPPHLKQPSPSGGDAEAVKRHDDGPPALSTQNALQDDESTEDEDDLDAVPKSAKPSQSLKKMGGIAAGQNHEYASSQASPKKLGTIGGRSLLPPVSSTSRKSTPEQRSPAPKPIGKLGKIGGKAKASTPAAAESEPSEHGTPPPAQDHKSDILGGKKGKESSTHPVSAQQRPEAKAAEIESPPRPRASTKQPSPSHRETSQDRADRKRDQLKRQLEEKAQAPVKKKRKF